MSPAADGHHKGAPSGAPLQPRGRARRRERRVGTGRRRTPRGGTDPRRPEPARHMNNFFAGDSRTSLKPAGKTGQTRDFHAFVHTPDQNATAPRPTRHPPKIQRLTLGKRVRSDGQSVSVTRTIRRPCGKADFKLLSITCSLSRIKAAVRPTVRTRSSARFRRHAPSRSVRPGPRDRRHGRRADTPTCRPSDPRAGRVFRTAR